MVLLFGFHTLFFIFLPGKTAESRREEMLIETEIYVITVPGCSIKKDALAPETL